jgi:thiol-disulfide isomerase/thioredoxin
MKCYIFANKSKHLNLSIIVFSFLLLFTPEKKGTVYIVVFEDCPICIYMSKPLREIYKEYNSEFNFKLVFPHQMSNYKTAHLFKEKYGLKEFETIIDEDQILSKKLGATITPEAIVVNNQDKILYRGRINDAYYAPGRIRHASREHDLKNLLQNILSNTPINDNWNKAVGCYITYEKR